MSRIPAPPDLTSLARRLAALERDLDAARGMRRLRSATISEGDLTLLDGGSVLVRNEDGDILVRVGPSEDGGNVTVYHLNGTAAFVAAGNSITFNGVPVGSGMFMQQDDGTDLLAASSEVPGGPMTVRISDTDGVAALHTDPAGNGLLNRPYLDTPLYPVFEGTTPWTTTSSTFTSRWLGRLWVTHPYVRVQIRAFTNGSTQGQARLLVGGTQIGSTITIPNSTSAAFFDFGNLQLPAAQLAAPYSFAAIEIETRSVTNGQATHVFPYGVTRRGTP